MIYVKSSPYDIDCASKRAGLLIAFTLHAVIVVVLLTHPPLRSAVATAMPIMVSLITSTPVAMPSALPKPLPVKPKPQQGLQPLEPPPLIVATTEAPASYAAPAPSTPQPQPPVAAATPKSAADAVAIAPITPPVFNADYLDNPPPVYPALSRRMSEQGKVVLRVLVNPQGGADQVELRTSSGSTRLDNAAVETVRRWRFVPARQGDQPIAAWVLIPISFTLQG